MTHRQRAQLLRELVTIKDRLHRQYDAKCSVTKANIADMNRRDEIERLLTEA